MKMKKVIKAVNFAALAHKDQKRKDIEQTPYINHPLKVADILIDNGVEDEDTIVAAILHDVIEDTDFCYDDIVCDFSKEIADLVLEVSDDKSLPKDERKRLQIEHAPFLSDKAKLIKIADKIANLEDILFSAPVGWTKERRIKYFEWANEVVKGAKGINKMLDDDFDKIYSFKLKRF